MEDFSRDVALPSFRLQGRGTALPVSGIREEGFIRAAGTQSTTCTRYPLTWHPVSSTQSPAPSLHPVSAGRRRTLLRRSKRWEKFVHVRLYLCKEIREQQRGDHLPHPSSWYERALTEKGVDEWDIWTLC